MPRLSTDHGRTADRVASIDPLELHQAIASASIEALRKGAPIERLDGLEYFHIRSAGFGVRNAGQQRRELLIAQIERQKMIAEQARENANTVATGRLRDAFVRDAENAYLELEQLEKQLEQLDRDERPSVLPDEFETEVDFIAHALAQLAKIRTTPSGEFGNAIQQVITDMRIVPHPVHRTCDVEFSLLLPADGMVLRFGPIRTIVSNRAYPASLPDDVRPHAPRLLLTRQATAHQLRSAKATSDHEILQDVKRALVQAGYTDLAAGIIVRSDFGPLFTIAAHDLWGEPLPDNFDPRYVELVLSTYRSPAFRWNPRHHSLDCALRQRLVDAVASRGGTLGVPAVIELLATTEVNAQRIAIFSRTQQLGDAPPWEPCLERIGEWKQQAPRSGRSLRVWDCPHCGGNATKVIRVPEVAACVICPDCRRMPVGNSPVFPEEYVKLKSPDT
jgi:hypothetical protein